MLQAFVAGVHSALCFELTPRRSEVIHLVQWLTGMGSGAADWLPGVLCGDRGDSGMGWAAVFGKTSGSGPAGDTVDTPLESEFI